MQNGRVWNFCQRDVSQQDVCVEGVPVRQPNLLDVRMQPLGARGVGLRDVNIKDIHARGFAVKDFCSKPSRMPLLTDLWKLFTKWYPAAGERILPAFLQILFGKMDLLMLRQLRSTRLGFLGRLPLQCSIAPNTHYP